MNRMHVEGVLLLLVMLGGCMPGGSQVPSVDGSDGQPTVINQMRTVLI